MTSRGLWDRLEALESAAQAKHGASVWFPDEDQPEDWDRADIQVSFPDAKPKP